MNTTSLLIVDLAYLAGLIDGEGCFVTVINSSRVRQHVQLNVKLLISNNHLGVIKWCQSTLGCGLIVRRAPNARQKEHWRYIIQAFEHLYPLLERLRPFLKIKQDQADLMLNFIHSRVHRPRGSPFNELETGLFYDLRLKTQHRDNYALNYKDKKYSREEFYSLVLTGRAPGYAA